MRFTKDWGKMTCIFGESSVWDTDVGSIGGRRERGEMLQEYGEEDISKQKKQSPKEGKCFW